MVLGAFVNTQDYSWAEIAWYVVGFLAWTPAYLMILWIGYRERRLEIPVLAAVGNITWELLWGFVFEQDMGWGLQVVYQGAFFIDAGILYLVFRYGRDQTDLELVRRWHPYLVVGLIAAWAAVYVGIHDTRGLELPLGSVSAYVVNLAESGVYLWFGLAILDPRRMSLTVAWSKLLGTACVSVFVFLRYDQPFVRTLAVVVGVLDLLYLSVLYGRRRAEPAGGFSPPLPSPPPAGT